VENDMTNEELDRLAERLAHRGDWGIVAEAERALKAAGDAGMRAVVRGLSHPDPPVRRGCAGFMDHNGTDAAVAALLAALDDPVMNVRREAVHALGCDRCKSSALCFDAVPTLIRVAASDPSVKVRREAVHGLGRRPPDPRAADALRAALARETDRHLRSLAHAALRHHDPAYRAEADAAARAAQTAAA
jgi:HEAT repeat protein